MNRKVVAVSLSLCLVAAVIIGIVAQTFAVATINAPANDSVYGEHGEVIVQLPQPSNLPNTTMPSHPTTIRIVANSIDERSSYGAGSTLLVQLWIPAANAFLPVAQVFTNPNPDLMVYMQKVFNNTPIWNPLMPNLIKVNSQSLNVWREGSLIIANLTTPVTITLPFNQMTTASASFGNQTFILPPLTLTFHPTGNPVPLHESTTLTSSGYTNDINSLMSPAWVRVDIPTWVKGAWLECSGHICTDLIQVTTPPKS